jgi:hypothetical protein
VLGYAFKNYPFFSLLLIGYRTPNFLGVIPGGQSFIVPESNITTLTPLTSGFTWNPSIRAGTTLILIGGDNRGNGSGGSTTYQVQAGPENDISCLSNFSPSSTAGNPAGGTLTGSGTPTGSVVRFVFSSSSF